MENNHFYKAKCLEVKDGDTIKVLVYLDFGFIYKTSIRLLGINAPEVHSLNELEKQAGLKVKQFLSDLMLDKEILLKSYKETFEKSNDKFSGRYLADIYYENIPINSLLIEKKYAKEYFGEKKEEWKQEELNLILNN